MTEAVMKICLGALVIAVCAFLLRELGWRGVPAFSVLSLAVFMGFASDGLSKLLSELTGLSETANISFAAKEIFKIMGASYIFGICSDICSELGEKNLASALSVAGRVEILLIVMPYFLEIVRYAAELVGK